MSKNVFETLMRKKRRFAMVVSVVFAEFSLRLLSLLQQRKKEQEVKEERKEVRASEKS